jgi:hypothetical protein
LAQAQIDFIDATGLAGLYSDLTDFFPRAAVCYSYKLSVVACLILFGVL